MKHTSAKSRFVLPLVFLTTFLLSGAGVGAQGDLRITTIEVQGLVRLSRDEVIATSGLKIGNQFSIDSVDAAAKQLADSGLFRKVSYRARTNGNAATIIFQVEESNAGESPVVFDNFIWFTEEQLREAVKREVPSFNGVIPDAGNTIDAVTRALQRLLRENKIGGTVEYFPSQDQVGSNQQEHVFSVTGISIPICALHYPGASNLSETKLIAQSKELKESDYSRKVASVFALAKLFPLYREVGQLRASFGVPVAKPISSGDCSDGVDLTIPVTEGLIYSFAKSEWLGNQALSADELGAALGMKQDEVANGLKFDKGLLSVRKVYGRKGYLDARIVKKESFDDATRHVSYEFELAEGPIYRMGNLNIIGFPPDLEKQLREKWQLKAGEVFDEVYFDEFLQRFFMQEGAQERAESMRQLAKSLERSYHQDRNKLTVDVILKTNTGGN